jgi:hypothetical protein
MSIGIDHFITIIWRKIMSLINLEKPEHAYFFGFAQTDGHLSQNTRNRGRLSIELQEKDSLLLEKCQGIFSCFSSIKKRTRNTNFKKEYSSVTLNIFDLEFRKEIEQLGLPVGSKSGTVKPPTVLFSEKDYWRGVIDGDGSLGITKTGRYFISLVTQSDELKEGFINYCFELTGLTKSLKRNARDNIYNIMYCDESAQQIVKELYYDGCLCLDRKLEKSKDVLNWVRDPNCKKATSNKKQWDTKQDQILLSNPIEKAAELLDRNINSCEMRLYRLIKKKPII